MWTAIVPRLGLQRVGGSVHRPVPFAVQRFLATDGDAIKDWSRGEATGATTVEEQVDQKRETRRGLTAKLLKGLLQSSKETKPEAPEKSALDFLEGPRLDIFPGEPPKTAATTESEHIENWRGKLESLSSLKEAEALAEMTEQASMSMQDFYGDKYGDLIDPMNRKLYDNDTNAAPDIRKNCVRADHKKKGLPLEEQIVHLNKMVMESGATNKLELCQAIPLLMCNTAWSMFNREEILRDHMEGVVDETRQEKMRVRKEKTEQWHARVWAEKSAKRAKAEALAAANLYDLQKEREDELDMDDEEIEVDWVAEAEKKRKDNIAKKASAKAAHYNALRKKKAAAKAKGGGFSKRK